jgi:hypothetical protein
LLREGGRSSRSAIFDAGVDGVTGEGDVSYQGTEEKDAVVGSTRNAAVERVEVELILRTTPDEDQEGAFVAEEVDDLLEVLAASNDGTVIKVPEMQQQVWTFLLNALDDELEDKREDEGCKGSPCWAPALLRSQAFPKKRCETVS